MIPLRRLATTLLALSAACSSGAAAETPSIDAGVAVGSNDAREQNEPDDSPARDGSMSDASPTIVFGGTIFRQKSDLAILGAEVCLLNQPKAACELTDSVGRFRFVVPAESNQAITVSAPGFGGIVAAFRTGRGDLTGYSIVLPTETDDRSYYGAVGVEWPSTARGFLYVFASDMNGIKLAGLRMALEPSSGSGPFYDNEVGLADKALPATSSYGTGHFAGIEPGELEVVFAPANLLCSSIFGGWPSRNQDSARIPIVAGFETHLGVRCF
jgi:hypothetical protein